MQKGGYFFTSSASGQISCLASIVNNSKLSKIIRWVSVPKAKESPIE